MADTSALGHLHDALGLPEGYVDPSGWDVDYRLLTGVVGAHADGCDTCYREGVARLAKDCESVARLIELACSTVMTQLGRMPKRLLAGGRDETTVEFAALAKAGLNGRVHQMREQCGRMSELQRVRAISSAVWLLVQHLPPGDD